MPRAVLACLVFAGIVASGDGAVSCLRAAELTITGVGLARTFKVGQWTPIRVKVTTGAEPIHGELQLVTPDAQGVTVNYRTEAAAQFPANSSTTVTGYVRPVASQIVLTARIVNEGQTVLESPSVSTESMASGIDSAAEWVVTIGAATGVQEAIEGNLRRGSQVRHLNQLEELPDQWWGYEGVDVIVLSTLDGDWKKIPPQRVEALLESIRMGGRMVLFCGRQAEELAASDSPLASLVPGPVEQIATLRQTAGLESYAGAVVRVGDGNPLRIPLAVFDNPPGEVAMTETVPGRGKVPIAIRGPVGFGQRLYVTLDLDEPVFASWDGRPRLAARILETLIPYERLSSRDNQPGESTQIGYNDLVGQLRGALDQFTGVTLVAFSWVAVLVGLYVLMIGPGDYFLLRRVLGRMHWSWITFPTVVLLFSVLACYGLSQLRQTAVRYNQVDLVDFDVEQQLLRGTSWTHVYSPHADVFDLGWPQRRELGETASSGLLVWQGLPGAGLGGLNAKTSLPSTAPAYTISLPTDGQPTPGRVRGLQIPASGTRSLSSRWWSKSDLAVEHELALNLETDQLEGSFANPLPVTLTDAALFFGNRYYALDRDLPAGGKVRVTGLARPRLVSWRLTRRRVVDQEAPVTIWNQEMIDDVPRILEVMMFHRAAGGRTYTRLAHRYQPYTDLTDHLTSARAILVGGAVDPAAVLERDGQSQSDYYDRHWTFCRVVFPVRSYQPETVSGTAPRRDVAGAPNRHRDEGPAAPFSRGDAR